jgi:DNA polymerase IV
MNSRWMYIDFNSYFASVEQQFDPRLRGKPIAVIPVASDATCAIAASYEAKAFGVKTGTPVWEAKKLCPKLICVLANHEAYVEVHHKILKEIDRHVPITKVCSIDEVACQLMNNESSQASKLAEKIKQGLRANVGECITCSIGLAPNCYLAKVATDMKKPNGLVFINQEDLPSKLYSLKLRDLPGIGANMEIRLKKHGIFDMEMLCSLDLQQMRRAWGSVEGERMWHRLRGVDLPDIETKRRSLGHSHVMAPELRDPEKARLVGRRLTAKAVSRLRRQGLVASRISLSVRLEKEERFELSLACDRVCDSFTFLTFFNEMWEQIIRHTGSAKIKKVSVTFSDLEERMNHQYELFANDSREKEEKASHVLDRINQKYGKDSISLGILPHHGKAFSGTKIAFTRIPDEEEFLE